MIRMAEGKKTKEDNGDLTKKVLSIKEEEKAKNYAFKLLSIKARSKKELTGKLAQKGFKESIIQDTINYLIELGYLNDRDFAKAYVQEKSKDYGVRRIAMELAQKGIDEDIINEVILEEVDEIDQVEQALEMGRKRIKYYEGEDRERVYRKLGLYLQRKGFKHNVIKRVLKELIP